MSIQHKLFSDIGDKKILDTPLGQKLKDNLSLQKKTIEQKKESRKLNAATLTEEY